MVILILPRKRKGKFEYTGADAIMIGRAALGNPWLFQAVEAFS